MEMNHKKITRGFCSWCVSMKHIDLYFLESIVTIFYKHHVLSQQYEQSLPIMQTYPLLR